MGPRPGTERVLQSRDRKGVGAVGRLRTESSTGVTMGPLALQTLVAHALLRAAFTLV
jgi:hypothetical protein